MGPGNRVWKQVTQEGQPVSSPGGGVDSGGQENPIGQGCIERH
jgi:hypothetical protein